MIWKKITVFTVVVLMSFFVAGGESIFAQKSADQSSKSASVKLIKDKPSVKKSDKGYEVSFSVKKATDVTVRIVNEKGEVVRHLASGFVGGDKAAKPFHPKSLSQTIVWDGNDDKGKNVTEKCKVSVGAGMNAKFDKYLLYNPDAFIAIGAIAVNSKGELYISGSSGVHDSSLRVFDKDGKYLRRDWPYSPALKGTVEFYNSKFVRGIPVPAGVPDYEGNTVPISINHSAAYYFYTQATGMGISPYGVALGNWCWGGPQFWVMKDGFPFQGVAITFPWAVGLKVRESKHIRVAIGPDRDFYIIDRDLNVLSHIHGETLEPVKSFSGDFMIKMQAPVSVAVQPNGNIWVTDKTGLTIFDKNGKIIKNNKEINGQLGCNLKTGAVYICKGSKLQKIESSETLAVVYECNIPEKISQIAVDSVNNIVWVMNGAGKDTLVRALDTGKSFDLQIIKGKKDLSVSFPTYPSVGDGKFYCTSAVENAVFVSDLDGKNCKKIIGNYGRQEGSGQSCLDSEGNLYVGVQLDWRKQDILQKYDHMGNRIKFGSKDSITLEPDVLVVRGLWIGPNKDIYLSITTSDDRPQEEMKPFVNKNMPITISRIDVYDKDGNLKEKGKVKLIDEFNIMLRGDKYLFWYHNGHGASNGVAVARDGSIYTVDAHAHNGSPLVRKYWENKNLSEPSRWRYSTEDKLVKFPPKGGQKSPGKSDTEWEHAGISGTGGWSCGYYECHTAQISVDEDDRVWCHDAAVYNVKALDAAGNLMLRVGVYGNEDCKGGGGNKKLAGTNIVIDPEIPLTRPTGMAVWKDLLFITDEYANRTVRCKLEYTDKEEVEVK